jgi:chromosome partitioning protein
MKTCVAVSLSGGQGKTTSIYMCAKKLAQSGKRVLAVDADPQANLTLFLGHEVLDQSPTLLEVLTGQVSVEDGIYPTESENIFLIPADRGLFKVNDYLSSSGTGAFILKHRLKQVTELFDYVLIDVQPSRSQLLLTAVGAADEVIIPVEANVKGFNSLVDTMEFLNEQANLVAFTGSILGVLPFRDKWTGNTQTLESRENIAQMSVYAGTVQVLPSILESEQYKRAIRQGQVPSDLGYSDLEYPFEKIMESLSK